MLRAPSARCGARPRAGEGYAEAARRCSRPCVPAIPYVPATTILGTEKAKLASREGEPGRVALVVDATGSMHGVTHTIERIREHGVPGWEVEVIGTDPRVDRRLPAVAEVEVPFYAGMSIGIPSVPELVETLVDGRYDLIHVRLAGTGRDRRRADGADRGHARWSAATTPSSRPTRGMRSGDPGARAGDARGAVGLLRPVRAGALAERGGRRVAGRARDRAERIGRWARGVDLDALQPARRRNQDAYPGEVKVLYAGRLTKEKGVDLLAESFLLARERDPRLHLLLAGGGPEEEMLRVRLGEHATFLGWLDREELAHAYASADVFLFCSQTDTYGQVIAEAQASGLPVVAVDEGGPRR